MEKAKLDGRGMRAEASTSLILKDNVGSLVEISRMLYKPWREMRTGSAVNAATDRRFTGQRWEAAPGLYHYGARWYDSAF